MSGRHRLTSVPSGTADDDEALPSARWKARLTFIAAGACATLVGQTIGLGMLDWPSGARPGFPWWEPPAYASPDVERAVAGAVAEGLTADSAAWATMFLPSTMTAGQLIAGQMSPFVGPLSPAARAAAGTAAGLPLAFVAGPGGVGAAVVGGAGAPVIGGVVSTAGGAVAPVVGGVVNTVDGLAPVVGGVVSTVDGTVTPVLGGVVNTVDI